MMRSIALDVSSVTIGWVSAEDGQRRFSGTYDLGTTDEPIQMRCWRAYQFVRGLILSWKGTEYVAIESPGGRFQKGVIPQVRVSGAVMTAAQELGVNVVEVSATEGKKALTGTGKADKRAMLIAAAPKLGYAPSSLYYQQGKRFKKPANSGDWRAWSYEGKVVFDEHEADAVGLALAAAATNLTLR